MLSLLIAFWLSGAWPANTIGPPPPRDANGVLITVGATVKLVGTVLSVNSSDTHGLEITFQPIHPSGTIKPPNHGIDSGPVSPQPGQPITQAAANQLVVGS